MKNKIYKRIITTMASVLIICSSVMPVNVLATGGDLKMKDPDHFINIGSVSKMYVVTAVMQLKEQGKVDLDAPVTDYITDFTMADERYKLITVRMLMNHTSGLMGSVYCDAFRYDDISGDYHDSFLDNLKDERLKADPGSYNCYCNDGFTLLEIIVERVSGMTFTEYLEKNICEPLELGSTGTMWNMKDKDKQITYYVKDDIKMAPECVQLMGAGGITSTAEDVCRFGYTFCYGNDILLSDASKKEMATNNKASEYCDDMGLGWDKVTVKDYENEDVQVLVKCGDTNVQHSALAVVPDHNISVAVLSSGGDSSVDIDLAYDLMDIALEEKGITVEHPEDEFKDTVDKVPEEFRKYEGNYTTGQAIVNLSFPDGKYMQIDSVTASDPFTYQFMYTTDGKFVEMTGDIKSGNAIQAKPVNAMEFIDLDGKTFVGSDKGIDLQKLEDNNVSDDVQKAWDNRSGKTYYLYGSGYSDCSYAIMSSLSLMTSNDAKGYVNGLMIIDEDHAIAMSDIPGSS